MEPENATAHCGELNPIIFNVEYMGIYNEIIALANVQHSS